jgi:hypothetical protein
MPANRTPLSFAPPPRCWAPLLLVPLMTACPKGDVGAPCNHGDVQPPDSQVVTFPALSCNDLLCVYATEGAAEGVQERRGVQHRRRRTASRFSASSGDCKLSSTYVLERSMCSRDLRPTTTARTAASARRCQAKETSCENGFRCAQIQKLGEFCCKKLCVCKRRPLGRHARRPQEGVRKLPRTATATDVHDRDGDAEMPPRRCDDRSGVSRRSKAPGIQVISGAFVVAEDDRHDVEADLHALPQIFLDQPGGRGADRRRCLAGPMVSSGWPARCRPGCGPRRRRSCRGHFGVLERATRSSSAPARVTLRAQMTRPRASRKLAARSSLARPRARVTRASRGHDASTVAGRLAVAGAGPLSRLA